jgi:protein ImuB
VSAELSMSADSMEPILFLVRPALERLVTELAAEGRAVAALAITLTLDDANGALPSNGRAHTVTREVRPARPVARVAPLFEQCRSLLASWPLTAPVSAVSVTIVATALATGEQGDLLHTGWRDTAAAEAAFFRLRAELGTESVVRPVARDEHRVDRSGAWIEVSEIDAQQSAVGSPMTMWFDDGNDERLTRGRIIRRLPQAASSAAKAIHERPRPGGVFGEVSEAGEEQVSSDRHAVALRLLESPEPADVEFAEGQPCALWWRGGRLTLTNARGPERLAGDWWKDKYQRDYWRCRTSEPSELLLYTERDAWWVQGWYD